MKKVMQKEPTRIKEARARLIRLPVNPPATDAVNCFDVQEIILTTLRDESGNSGSGFGYTIGRGGSTVLELLRAELLPRVLGQDSRFITRIGRGLKADINTVSSGCIPLNALASIDVALWDLAGKRLGQPVYQLFGGAKTEVPIYNTDVGWLNRELDEMLELCREALARGFRAVKLKLGKPDAAEDVERVAKVRETVGPHIDIMADANTAWKTDEAIRRLKRLVPYDLVWIEEPIRVHHIQDYQELKKHIDIPIAGGESLSTAADFYEFARLRAFDIFQPDVARVGGLTNAIEICSLANSAGIRVAPHVSPELSLVVAAAVENSFYIEYIPQMEPILKHRIEVKDGVAHAPAAPGTGIPFDEEMLDRYEVKEYALAA